MVKDPTKPPKTDSAAVEHERLSSLVNSMADGVIALSKNAKIVLYNGAALNLLDINVLRAGSSIGNVMHLCDKNGTKVDFKSLILSTHTPTTTRDLLLTYPDGSSINLYISLAPVHLGYGHTGDHGFVVLFRDITREKSLEEERDEFISVVSHELRTPIAVSEGNISNAMFVVEKNGGLDSVKAALKQAHEQVLFLSDMVNDLSTLSRKDVE